MDERISSRLQADLFLLHAPSVYDFRERDDMLFAYLSDSDSVNVTSVYEMYPIGADGPADRGPVSVLERTLCQRNSSARSASAHRLADRTAMT